MNAKSKLEKCSPVLAGLFIASVAYSGVMTIAGHKHSTIWPFSRSWYMFSSESPWHTALEASFIDDSGQEIPVNLHRWFRAPGSETTFRIEELPREKSTLERFAKHLCFRAKKTKNLEEVKAVSIREVFWQRRTPLSMDDEKLRSARVTQWVDKLPCR